MKKYYCKRTKKEINIDGNADKPEWQTVTLNEILSKYHLDKVPEGWQEDWGLSQAIYPGENNLWYLEEDYLKEANNTLNLNKDAFSALLNAAAKVKKDTGLCRLSWHCVHMMFCDGEIEKPYAFYFPTSEQFREEFNGLFDALVLVSNLDKIVKVFKERDIPMDIIKDTFSDLQLWLDHYYSRNGKWGLSIQWWLLNHFTGKIFKLGRLQFVHQPFQGDIKVFRNKHTGKVLAFSDAGIKFRQDGQVDGTNGIFDEEDAWISEFHTDNITIKGNLISPFGYACQGQTELSPADWELVLYKGLPVLEMHIPATGRMSHHLCGDSINMAMSFYKKYYPEKAFYAFSCWTWLYDPQFQKLLPADSNIVRFQREVYLCPVISDDAHMFSVVFGGRPEDLSNAPRDTTLQKAILNYMENGGLMRAALGFLLADELNWGGEVYQKAWED